MTTCPDHRLAESQIRIANTVDKHPTSTGRHHTFLGPVVLLSIVSSSSTSIKNIYATFDDPVTAYLILCYGTTVGLGQEISRLMRQHIPGIIVSK